MRAAPLHAFPPRAARYKFACINIDPRKPPPEWLKKMLNKKPNTMANRLEVVSAKGMDAKTFTRTHKAAPSLAGETFSYDARPGEDDTPTRSDF